MLRACCRKAGAARFLVHQSIQVNTQRQLTGSGGRYRREATVRQLKPPRLYRGSERNAGSTATGCQLSFLTFLVIIAYQQMNMPAKQQFGTDDQMARYFFGHAGRLRNDVAVQIVPNV